MTLTEEESELENTVNCLVCGDDVNLGSVVYCDRDETPHHKDCWEYNEGCAVYACNPKSIEAAEENKLSQIVAKSSDEINYKGITKENIGCGVVVAGSVVTAAITSMIPYGNTFEMIMNHAIGQGFI